MKEEKDKTGAIVKLGLWLIFISVLTISVKLGGNKIENNIEKVKEEIKEEIKEISYEDKLNKLDNNYKYEYIIKIENDTFKYTGTKMIKNNYVNESGVFTHNEEVKYNYFLENGFSYIVNNGGLDKLETIYDIRINPKYLDLIELKNELLNKEYRLDDEKYVYEIEERKIVVSCNKDDITTIEIFIGEDFYKLNISDIGKIKDITY